MNLSSIEEELRPLLAERKATWPRMAELMLVVDAEELWREGEFESFTKWLEAFAEEMSVTSGYLWQILRAGRTYAEFQDRAEETGEDTNDITEIEASAEALVLCDKISCGDPDIADNYIRKVLNGDISTKQLKDTWAEVRERKDEAQEAGTEVDVSFLKDPERSSKDEFRFIAKKALSSKWLESILTESTSTYLNMGTVEKPRSKLFSGLKVDDVKLPEVVIENYTGHQTKDVKVHLIAISEIEDQSVTRYADFCWVLTEDEYSPPSGWGVLNLSSEEDGGKVKYSVEAVEYPTRQQGRQREDVIYAALLK